MSTATTGDSCAAEPPRCLPICPSDWTVGLVRRDSARSSEVIVTESVRLDGGYYLWVEDGPLIINNVPWYRVGHWVRQSTNEAPDSQVRWGLRGDDVAGVPMRGWREATVPAPTWSLQSPLLRLPTSRSTAALPRRGR